MISSNISTTEYKPLKIEAKTIIKAIIIIWNALLLIYIMPSYTSQIISYPMIATTSIMSIIGVIVTNTRTKQIIGFSLGIVGLVACIIGIGGIYNALTATSRSEYWGIILALCIVILIFGIIFLLTGIFIIYDTKSQKLFKFKVLNRNEDNINLSTEELLV